MRLLVAIPALNEAATIGEVIARVPREMPGIDRVDVVVIDDGSTDDTASLAKQAGASVIRHGQNLGVGMAFQSAFRYALVHGASLLVTIDGDGQFEPEQIPLLIAPILAGDAEVCTASRFLDPALVPEMPRIKLWGNRQVATLVRYLTGRSYSDVSCGFRAYARSALLKLTVHHSFTYTHEVFLDLAAKQVRIEEVALAVRGIREHGQSRVASSVVRYGLRTASIMLRTYRDYQPLALCSWLAVPPAAAGAALLVWSLATYLHTNSWMKAGALTGGALLGLAVAFLFFGFMADMTTRLRRNQEEIIFWLRSRGDADGSYTSEGPGGRGSMRPPGVPRIDAEPGGD